MSSSNNLVSARRPKGVKARRKSHLKLTFPKLSGPNRSWSPNTLRTRLVLNYKHIPYTQSYLSYTHISPILRSFNLAPLSNGPVPYTLPAIIHAPSLPSETGHALNDSWPIAQHLERTFPAPEYPSIFPTPASYPLAVAVQKILANVMVKGMSLHIPKVPNILEPSCAEYFHRTRAVRFGKSLPDFAARGPDLERVWADIEAEFETLAAMLRGAQAMQAKTGPFFEGDKLGYADLVVVAWLGWYFRNDRADWERLVKVGKEADEDAAAAENGPILFKPM
ncbi:predicted protein [Uncinocarpus reesii 1704]|uniref:Uncharacterized protein n=1 Tax=Uncinocarpus reesii (strain UAMH 1704) TaxID=336963 RepID=C4JX75_UNCRE|nr:uncharacterized protein UREG_06248 [Uncinocarpus reesii 1704]EEP81383.1 predicted protein [Uncinocarpus reesii 1704]